MMSYAFWVITRKSRVARLALAPLVLPKMFYVWGRFVLRDAISNWGAFFSDIWNGYDDYCKCDSRCGDDEEGDSD